MLRLRSCFLAQLFSSRSASPVSPIHRLLSAVSPDPSSFAVEEYLVSTCGLTRPQALKAYPKLSHLKSPANPDAVLAFLAGLGLSGADVAALVAKDPQFLCASVERVLAPNVDELTGLGLSRSDIARLIPLTSGGRHFRCRSIVSKLHFYLPLFGSSENLLRALNRNFYLIGADMERKVKPNVALLHECGLGACDIVKLCRSTPRMLSTSLERTRAMVECAQGLGVPRGSAMFKHALDAVSFISEDKIAAKVDYLKKTFRWSDAEVGMALSRSPMMLRRSKDALRSKSEFLISEVGLEPEYIAHRPAMLNYSLDGRLRPRYYVVKFLKANGLLDRDRDYYATFTLVEKVFVRRYVCPYKEAAPQLAEDYDAARSGELPANFKFT
ncbi:transcription termination factor MTERF8, chloroplastic-like [Hordeum vulgare subsp. vulgare]|nr:transcription termination factor MTERF8, chloroplastic-like [Hordeum vulgare subsp. vulgare]